MSTEASEAIPHYGDDGHSASAPQAAAGESSSPGTNSGSSGRRRRRRRKGKGPGGAPAQGQGVQASPVAEDGGAQPEAAFQSAAAFQPAAGCQSGPGAQPASPQPQNSNQQQGKRKKRNRNGGGGPQPGNTSGAGQHRQRQARAGGGFRRSSDGPDGNREGARGGFGSGSEHFQDANGNANGRRKGKFGRGGRPGFVGPMDHSYRAVNGNVADGPPSTMDYRNGNANGNIHGRNDSVDVEQPAVPREDAPTRIVCFIEDLFIVTKMNEAARKMGIRIQFAKAEKETLAALTDGPEAERPALIVFDLNNANAKPLTVIPKLKAKLKRGTSIIGFLQHIQGDLKLKAVEAGCDTVMPRSAFSLSLPNLLRRYGLHEEEEMAEA